MRTKTIELDGAKWTIAPLTLREVEEWLIKQKEALDMPEGAARDRQLAQAWREFIAMGFNNVYRLENGKFPEPLPPTMVKPDEIPDRLDLHAFEVLRDELLSFSRMKGSRGASPGEAPAAS